MKFHQYILLILFVCGCTRPPNLTPPTGFVDGEHITGRPFQIIHAENVRNAGDSVQLTALNFLSKYDIVKLEETSYLLLVHFSGMFFTFEGDTVINLATLSKEISQELNIENEEINHRAGIQFLFQNEAYIPKYSNPVLRIESFQGIQMLTPALDQTQLSANASKICLKWRESPVRSVDVFQIIIKDIFDEVLDTMHTKSSYLDLDLSRYESEGNLYIIKIKDSRYPRVESIEFAIILGNEQYYIPKNCKIRTAEKALEMAYYLEYNQLYTDAEEYYLLATSLSERPIFDQLLKNFQERKRKAGLYYQW